MSDRAGVDVGTGPEQSADDAGARAVLQAIGDRARQTNLRRVQELGAVLTTAQQGGLEEAGWEAATTVAHQLVGSVGTFGYRRASATARELERFFADRGETPGGLPAAAAGLAGIERDLNAGPDLLD